jgi:hypothetical protein
MKNQILKDTDGFTVLPERVEHIAEEFQRALQTPVLVTKSEDDLRSVIIQIALLGGRRARQ